MRSIIRQQGKGPPGQEDVMLVLLSPWGYSLNATRIWSQGCRLGFQGSDLSGHTMLLAVLSVSALKNEIILCKWKITSANGLAFTDGLGSSEQDLGVQSLHLPRRSSGKAWPPLDQVGKCCWATG